MLAILKAVGAILGFFRGLFGFLGDQANRAAGAREVELARREAQDKARDHAEEIESRPMPGGWRGAADRLRRRGDPGPGGR